MMSAREWELNKMTSHGLLNVITATSDKDYKLNSPTQSERGEQEWMNGVNSAISKFGKPMDISIGSMIYKNIYGVNKVAGTPKADLVLVTLNSRGKLEDSCYISHKMGSLAKHFGQWSGMSANAGSSIASDPEVKAFVKFVQSWTKSVPGWTKVSGFTLIKKITGKKLKMRAVYGPDFGSGSTGVDNVDMLLQGPPQIRVMAQKLTIEQSHILLNGEEPKGDYIPYLMAIKKVSDARIADLSRSARTDFGIRGMRMSIYPIGGRRHTHDMDDLLSGK